MPFLSYLCVQLLGLSSWGGAGFVLLGVLLFLSPGREPREEFSFQNEIFVGSFFKGTLDVNYQRSFMLNKDRELEG